MFNWWLLVPLLILGGLRVSTQHGTFSVGLWLAAAVLLYESVRVLRILSRIGDGIGDEVIRQYFEADSARRWFSVRDAVAGIHALAETPVIKGERDGAG